MTNEIIITKIKSSLKYGQWEDAKTLISKTNLEKKDVGDILSLISRDIFSCDDKIIDLLIDKRKDTDFNKIGMLGYLSGNSRLMKKMIPHINCDETLSMIASWALEWDAWDTAKKAVIKVKNPGDETIKMMKLSIIKDNKEIIEIMFERCIDGGDELEEFIKEHDIKTSAAMLYLNLYKIWNDKNHLKEKIENGIKSKNIKPSKKM